MKFGIKRRNKMENVVQKFHKITESKKGDFHPRTSMYLYKDTYGNVTGNDRVVTERCRQHSPSNSLTTTVKYG
jgi:hypothetical protein